MKHFKIVLTGSIGNIGKPLAKRLVADGHQVTVVSSKAKRSEEILALGATPAIGALQDTKFLASTLQGADLIFSMVPPADYFDPTVDILEHFVGFGTSFVDAIAEAGVRRVINLSSIGAHLEKGSGILVGMYHVEQRLNSLPEDVAVTHIRCTEFYSNLFQFLSLIKVDGFMSGNLAGDDFNAWVSVEDIVDAVAEEINTTSTGRKVRYVASEELSYNELASILGSAIGKPDLKWVMISDEQLQERLEGVQMQPRIAKQMTEMYAAVHSGLLYEDYHQHKPSTTGKTKVKDFAKDFAAAYFSA